MHPSSLPCSGLMVVVQDQLVQVQAERAQDKALAERLLAKQALAVQAIKKEIDMLLLDVLNREDKVQGRTGCPLSCSCR